MAITICENRQRILDAKGHVLVSGGPGSGKTTIALKKAVSCIHSGLRPGQAILFLSLSNAAVARIIAVSKIEVDKDKQNQLKIQTFHSFFWEILRSHGYLLGSPKKRLEILLPHDANAISGGLRAPEKDEEPSEEWLEWKERRQRLFYKEGKIVFDLFAPQTVMLLQRSPILRDMVSNRYPLIIVDEAQDTGSQAWKCIELLSEKSQVICMVDLTQQIFDYLDDVDPDRIEHIQHALSPLEVDLGQENNRSPDTEINLFAKNILHNTIKDKRYKGVSWQRYRPQNNDRNKMFRIALSNVYRKVNRLTGEWPKNIAILATSGVGVGHITSALSSDPRPVNHQVLYDADNVLHSARLAAFILEPKSKDNLYQDVAKCLEYLANLNRAKGSSSAIGKASTYFRWAESIRNGKKPHTKLAKAVENLIGARMNLWLVGDPKKDWTQIKDLLRRSNHDELSKRARDLNYLVGFNQGKRINRNLLELWINEGSYTRAREALENALVEAQLFSQIDVLNGIHVMTIHKSKGKQFSAVIIFRQGSFRKGSNRRVSSLVWRDDPYPYNRSRQILRVGITRAEAHVLLLDPFFPDCPILTPHRW